MNSTSLSNGTVRFNALLPGQGYYSATRFTQALLLDGIAAHGHTYYPHFHEDGHDPLLHDSVPGPAEEFDLEPAPQTHDLAAPGGAFLKIGVGVLRRGAEPYSPFRLFEILDPGTWRVSPDSPRSLAIEHAAALPDGSYGYRLTYRVWLPETGAVIHIDRTLENTGRNTLSTRHYNHNFIRIDDHPIGPDYSVELAFPVMSEKPLPPPAVIEGNAVRWTVPIRNAFFWSGFTGNATDNPAHNAFTLRHAGGCAVRYVTDAPLHEFRLFSTSHAMCPEPFTRLVVAPGSTVRWNSTITLK